MSVQPAPSHARYRAPDPPPSGVGGWLAFFIFGTLVFGGIIIFGNAQYLYLDMKTIHREFPSIRTRDIFYVLGHVAWLAVRGYGILAGLQLWKVRPGAVETAKRFLVLCAMVAAFQLGGHYLLFGLNTSQPAGGVDAWNSPGGKALITFLQTMLYVVVWYEYFLRSRRVKNTYEGVLPAPQVQGVAS
ncbi:MAG: DUF2569 family protein [Candidatus Acidiferrales bacterium]